MARRSLRNINGRYILKTGYVKQINDNGYDGWHKGEFIWDNIRKSYINRHGLKLNVSEKQPDEIFRFAKITDGTVPVRCILNRLNEEHSVYMMQLIKYIKK